jgi:hypothetical protein
MKKINRMVKEGYVEKMKVAYNGHNHRNGSQIDVRDLDNKLDQISKEDDQNEEDEGFYEDPSFGKNGE